MHHSRWIKHSGTSMMQRRNRGTFSSTFLFCFLWQTDGQINLLFPFEGSARGNWRGKKKDRLWATDSCRLWRGKHVRDSKAIYSLSSYGRAEPLERASVFKRSSGRSQKKKKNTGGKWIKTRISLNKGNTCLLTRKKKSGYSRNVASCSFSLRLRFKRSRFFSPFVIAFSLSHLQKAASF